MTKKVLTILLTVLLFLSAVVLGGSTVFRVDDIAVKATVSEESKTNLSQLQGDLKDLYEGKGIFSVKEEDVTSIVAQYPYFRMTEFEKHYPNKIIVTIEEETEVYAVERAEGGYYILGETGMVLEIRDSSINRLDNVENVIIKGVTLSGQKGESLVGDECWASMLLLCQRMNEKLGGIRSNVLSVEVLIRTPEIFYMIEMREGVKIYVGDPSVMTEEKAKKAMDEYMALSTSQRMTGRLTVRDMDGQVLVGYSPENEFED